MSFETPTLGLYEKYMVQSVLENRLTDVLYIGNFTLQQFVASIVIATFGGSQQVEGKRWVGTGGWVSTAIPCRAMSLGAEAEQKSSSTFYIQRMQFTVALDTSIDIPQSPYVELTGGTHANKYVTDIQGTWIAYDGVVYRIDGITTYDTMPTVMVIEARQDSFSKDTAMEIDAVWTEAYLYAGSAIAANTTVPSNPSIIMYSTTPPIAIGANGSYVRTK